MWGSMSLLEILYALYTVAKQYESTISARTEWKSIVRTLHRHRKTSTRSTNITTWTHVDGTIKPWGYGAVFEKFYLRFTVWKCQKLTFSVPRETTMTVRSAYSCSIKLSKVLTHHHSDHSKWYNQSVRLNGHVRWVLDRHHWLVASQNLPFRSPIRVGYEALEAMRELGNLCDVPKHQHVYQCCWHYSTLGLNGHMWHVLCPMPRLWTPKTDDFNPLRSQKSMCGGWLSAQNTVPGAET